MVATRPPTSKPSSPFNNSLVTVPKSPITIGIIVTFMLHSFFSSLARSRYLSFFLHFFLCVSRDSKVDNFTNSLLFVDYYQAWSSGRDYVICVYVKVPKEFMCHFLGQMLHCAYTICSYGQI